MREHVTSENKEITPNQKKQKNKKLRRRKWLLTKKIELKKFSSLFHSPHNQCYQAYDA